MGKMAMDTDPRTEKVLIELYRKADATKKFALVCSMSETVRALSRRAIARANKGISDQELDILFVEYHYGKNLAEKLKKYLDQKKNETT